MIIRILCVLSLLFFATNFVIAQADSSTTPVQGGVYNRPFITSLGRAAIGGYAEANSNYFMEDGVTEGFSMEIRRFNIFMFAPIGERLRFISELEFEHGTEEIALETAQLDFQLDPRLVLRAGVILPPLGAFNANHDSPRWEFIDRPLVSTRIIPATLSEVGFGAYGRLKMKRGFTVTYDAYLTNGLSDGIILNDEGRTSIPAGKSEEQFEEDNNGSPAISGRIAVQRRSLGELGFSWYNGVYNSFRVEGERIDDPRRVRITALDANTEIGPLQLRGELARAHIDIPSSLNEIFGHKQWGMHLDAIAPVWHPRFASLKDAVLNIALRIERVDFNVGSFASTGERIFDDITAFVPGVTFRPVPETVFKLNYRVERTRDFAGNPPSRRAGYQVGFATYF